MSHHSGDTPLVPPRPRFFLNSTEDIFENLSDPVDGGAPRTSTPSSAHLASDRTSNANPFSPPASVRQLSFSFENYPAANSFPGTNASTPVPSSPEHSRPASIRELHASQSISSFHFPGSTPIPRPTPTRSMTGMGPGDNGHSHSNSRGSLAYPPRFRRMHSMPSVSSARLRSVALNQARMVSTALDPLGPPPPKPWISHKDRRTTLSWWITLSVAMLGVLAGAVRTIFGIKSVYVLKDSDLCLVLDDDFNTFNTDVWKHENDLSGFGNGEFEMTTSSTNNTFISDSTLYLVPTLTSLTLPSPNDIFDAYTFNLTGCTNTNASACGAVSNQTTHTVINPIMSSRITTNGTKSIRFGKVEVRAKVARGDWIWPAIWMMPVNSTYGPWPLSGEIDLMESRGNGPEYPAQGRNYVRGALNWGPISFLNGVLQTAGWWMMRRSDWSKGFHTYTLEWTEDFIRVYVDSRLHHLVALSFNEPFFERGQFPPVVSNGSQDIVLNNPWKGRGNAAPFDQDFYLIMNVAVGGTNGWFPDGQGNKPWLDGSLTAMYDFAKAQDQWYPTWPTDPMERGMAIDYVKMWQKCK